jgi:predicted DNA-binding protein YlxM (UPF0122 family)
MKAMMSELSNTANMSLLYDYYGALLNARRNSVFCLYHEDNLSLGEISDRLGISRQAVHEALKRAEAALADYEQKLGLVAKHAEYLEALQLVEKETRALASESLIVLATDQKEADRVRRRLSRMQSAIKRLDI